MYLFGDGNGRGEPALAIPLKVRDRVIGAFTFRKGENGQKWRPDEVALLENLTDELGLALENARLYQETQHRAAHERMINEITARMRQTLDVDRVLQTAIREMRATLNLAEAEVRMGVEFLDEGAAK